MMKSVAHETSNLILEKAMIRTNSEGTITEFCGNAEKLLGYSSEEMVGQNILKIFSGLTILEEYNQDKKTEKSCHELRANTKYHHTVLLNVEHSFIKNEEDTITGFYYSLQNISGENILEEKEAIIRAIIESSDDSIISKTMEGIISSWNPTATRMFGYTEAEAIGKHISFIIPPDRLEEEDFIIDQISSCKAMEKAKGRSGQGNQATKESY